MRFVDLSLQHKGLKSEIDGAIMDVIRDGSFILGKRGKKLEEKVASFVGVRNAIGVNSGTDALLLSLHALGVGLGDEVIVPVFTFMATAEVVVSLGATPVFVDIDSSTFALDLLNVKEVVTSKTKAVIPVHLYGQMADMGALMVIAEEHGIVVVEDVAQAIGATFSRAQAGSLGTIGCFSFFPAKNLGAFGDAGMIVTNDNELAERLRLLRNHGARKKYQHEVVGWSSRLDEIQAAVLLVKLPHLKEWNEARSRIAKHYSEELDAIDGVTVPVIAPGRTHVFQQYTIRVQNRDALQSFLEERNIPTAVHYPSPLSLQPAFSAIGHSEGDFPNAEKAAGEVLSLPMYPELAEDDQEGIIAGVKAFFI